jgi:hypothetical protein
MSLWGNGRGGFARGERSHVRTIATAKRRDFTRKNV